MQISLQPWKRKYLQDLIKIANNANVARTMNDHFPHPYTKESGKAFIEMAKGQKPTRIFAIVADDVIVGAAGIHPQDGVLRKNAEIGYWLGEEYWGKGFAAEAVKQLVAYSFNNFDVNRLFGRVFENNTASAKVLQKNGFVLEAKFNKTIFKNGEYLDEFIYALRKPE